MDDLVERELAPCPFCGADGDMLTFNDNRWPDACWIACEICEAEGPVSNIRQDFVGAAEAWNTRAGGDNV